MYQITAKGARAPIETAWDALAWADPSPAGAVDAKEDGRAAWRLDAFTETLEEAEACVEVIQGVSPELVARIEELEDRDWVTLSLEGLPPVSAGPFFVAGSHALAKMAPGKIAVLIEAGPAFGTGHHGTTLGCLLALDEVRRRHAIGKVLDLGTGSGVLAIAAMKAGAHSAIGTDIDFDSVRVANENAVKNHVTGFTALHITGANSPRIRQRGPYDTVFANILMKPLIGLAPTIAPLTAPGGTIILSGLLHHQAAPVRNAFASRGLSFHRRIKQDGWSTLVFRKPDTRQA
jgi:ribosomal protein L11 methyltransferase